MLVLVVKLSRSVTPCDTSAGVWNSQRSDCPDQDAMDTRGTVRVYKPPIEVEEDADVNSGENTPEPMILQPARWETPVSSKTSFTLSSSTYPCSPLSVQCAGTVGP